MRLSWKALLALTAVFAASLVGAIVLPVTDTLRAVTVAPGVAALIGAVFVIVRDHAAHERTLAVHRDDQQFQVGAMSHMSAVVFDKHVAFCEEYMAEVNKTIETLVREHANIGKRVNNHVLPPRVRASHSPREPVDGVAGWVDRG